jgi:hydroxymethylbilane synthase
MYQSRRIADALRQADPSLDVEIVGMSTKGDELQDQSVPEIGGKGLFTDALERGLLADELDLAVHSLKDLPTRLPDGLTYAGSTERGTVEDAFVSPQLTSVDELSAGDVVATGSRRRRAELKAQHPEVEFVDLRGNIETRLDKLQSHDWAGLIMAAVALERLGLDDKITTRLDPMTYVPAVGQGAIGIEIAEDRDDIRKLLTPIFDDDTVTGCRAERAFMRILEGGCTVPLGGYAVRTESGAWLFRGWVGRVDGTDIIEETRRGDDPVAMAESMAHAFIDRGAVSILRAAEDD